MKKQNFGQFKKKSNKPKLTRDIVSIIKQIIEDKIYINNYIRKHGTLKGIKKKGIKFVQPV